MPQATDTRLHPIRALRAIRALQRDREDTKQVFLLIEALRGKTTLRQLNKFRATEFGRRALTERPRLFDRLEDWDTLKALPAGTLGRAYYEFMASENLSAAGLVEASKVLKRPPASDDMTWFRERNRETHDLLHIVTGYGRDPMGEACLVAFTYAQTGQKGFLVIALNAARRASRFLPRQPVKRAIFEGYRRGRQAEWLIGADWEALLRRPLEEVRRQFGVEPAHYYPTIVAAISRARLIKDTRPAAAMPA
ncbi:MAG: ubiquinone biosynthesis protein [Alphaproteobacteria bacterium]|nr:ubiquinone biosynthesis protein [Alphaproteobacteria bacterium]